MEPFVEALADLCRAHPTRAKWVFVPAHATGRTLGDRLVLSGTDWVNLRFVTPFDVALGMGAPFLVERGIDPSEEGLGPALVMRLLLDLPEEGGYFRPLAAQPSMAAALWSTIRELRMAAVTADGLAPAVFESPAKHAELATLLAAYEAFLAGRARGDRATVFREALAHPDWCPIRPEDCWTTLPDVAWTRLERRFFDGLPGERIAPRTFALPNLEPPRRLRDVPAERVPPGSANALGWLTLPDARAPDAPVARFAMFHAGGADAEIEEVFRRILAAGVSLDEVEIVCASPAYAALAWEKALGYAWPVTTSDGVALTQTRPGRALVALAEWIEDDFSAGRLRRLLQSGDIRLDVDSTLPPARAARLLVDAEAAWGRDTYRLALTRLAAESRRRAARDDLPAETRERLERRAAEADALRDWIAALIGSVPTPGSDGLVPIRAMADAARAFVERAAARTSALDAAAATVLAAALAELDALDAFRSTPGDALRFLRERVEGHSVAADRPRPGHLHVCGLTNAGFSGRRHVFVTGLEEGRVFPLPLEDAVLLDDERARVDASLRRSGDRTEEAVYAALVRLAAIGADPDARVTFSYSCRDLAEYRQTFASWVLLQVFRATTGRADASFHDLHEHLGAPVSVVPADPDAALDESRWWLRRVVRGDGPAAAALIARYPALAAGQTARAHRQSPAFTAFDGDVPEAGVRLDPARSDVVISPTQLEDAAACPFRHFLRRGLGVDAIETGERDRDVWLNPLVRGSLLHDLYARLLGRCREAGRRASLEADAAWLRDAGLRLLREVAVETPPPSDEVRDRETRLFLDDLALFLEAEAALPATRTPIGFEVAFGRAGDGEADPLAQAEPVEVDLGGFIVRLAGRIDRIDKVGPHAYEIVDYKTGSYYEPRWKGTFAGGTRLQHALYGLAAATLLRRVDPRATVAGAEYYFSSARGNQERKRIPAPSRVTVAAVLGDLRDVIASGRFVHAPDRKTCDWCHHGRACGRDAHARALGKLSDARLATFVRLTRHE